MGESCMYFQLVHPGALIVTKKYFHLPYLPVSTP